MIDEILMRSPPFCEDISSGRNVKAKGDKTLYDLRNIRTMTTEENKVEFRGTSLDLISVDDTFYFRCTKCGKCCKERDDIILSPYDLYRMAKYLGKEIEDIINSYTRWHIGESSKLPVVMMRMRGEKRTCPFLDKHKCRIHEAKPAVCALFPLGRIAQENGDIRYLIQPIFCGGHDKRQTVREWIAEFGLEESEAWFRTWQETIVPLVRRVNEIYVKVSEMVMHQLEEVLFITIYLAYSMDEPIIPQFQRNIAKMDEMLTCLEELLEENDTREEKD